MPHVNRAGVLSDLDRWQDAVAGYDRAIALSPDFAEAHLGRAFALKQLGQLDEALAAVDRAIELKPDTAAAHKARGSVLEALGRADEAKASIAKAAEIETRRARTPARPRNKLRRYRSDASTATAASNSAKR